MFDNRYFSISINLLITIRKALKLLGMACLDIEFLKYRCDDVLYTC